MFSGDHKGMSAARADGSDTGPSPGPGDMFTMVGRAVELASKIGPALRSLPVTSTTVFTEETLDSSLSSGDEFLDESCELEQMCGDCSAVITEDVKALDLYEACDSNSGAVPMGADSSVLTTESDIIDKDDATSSNGDSEFTGSDIGMDSVIELTVEFAELLMSLKNAFSSSSRPEQESLASHITSLPGALEQFHSLLFDIFEVTQGLSSVDALAQIYLLVLTNLEGWVDVSGPLCARLAGGGKLLGHVNELKYLGQLATEKSEVIQSAAETHLSIIYNCTRNHPLPNYYSAEVPWVQILSDWETSTNEGLRFICKLLAGVVFEFLGEDQVHHLDMSESDMLTLLTALSDAASSHDSTAEAFGYSYTVGELLNILLCACRSTANFRAIANSQVLEILTRIAVKGEKVASLRLLYCLLEQPKLVAALKTTHGDFLVSLEKDGTSEDIKLWSEGILATLNQAGVQEANFLARARCLYALKKHQQCEELCSKIPNSLQASLLKGKALYGMYQRMQQLLRKQQNTLEPKTFFTQHKACYDMALKVIRIFRRHDYLDAECSQLLDFAMLDYILETNKLKDVDLCFLCLKRSGAIADSEVKASEELTKCLPQPEPSEPIEDDTEVVKSKRTPQPNIRFSHLIPHAVIRYFMKSADVDQSSRSVLFGGQGTKLAGVKKRTPGKAGVYLLCPSCEHNLNVLGEQAFLRFLEQVYDPLCSSTGMNYDYGKEMYHFCIGLIFRTLFPSQDSYINTDEVYQLLLQCRAFLTSGQASGSIPEVFMFICPSEDDSYDEDFCRFINQDSASYTALISLDCRVEWLGKFASVLANFFLVKLGVIVLIVRFSPASKEVIDTRFQINPEAGSYFTPASKMRRALIPAGVWTALHLLYVTSESDRNIV